MTEYKFKQIQPGRTSSVVSYVGIYIPAYIPAHTSQSVYVSKGLLEKLDWPEWVTVSYDSDNEALLIMPATARDRGAFKLSGSSATQDERAARTMGRNLVMMVGLRHLTSQPGRWIMTEQHGAGAVLRPARATNATGGGGGGKGEREAEATV